MRGGLAVLVVVKLIPFGTGVELTPNRVVVIPFENRTGDESLDQIGAMAADWLTEGLMQLAGTVEPVPTLQVMQLLKVKRDRDGRHSAWTPTSGLQQQVQAP